MELEITSILHSHLHDDGTTVVDEVTVGWGDATKHRQVLTSAAGHTLRLRLPRGSFLSDGSVLWHDDTLTVVVRRPPEDAIVVRLGDNITGSDAAARLIRLGYVLGNAHAPVEYTGEALQTPLFTSASGATDLLSGVGVVGGVECVPLARHGWSSTSADHREHHRHE
ncbi:urease accessory protein UreE [Gordonia westfalica]|uniref:Urease accessory protein UreE n=1 Tax=Gordonia westfalica TaxID=158898 RepID=A0ABU2GWC6_9ACTN|nr:urease accessory protein UreE [Gordonia westfalica]MDS1115264.1 urease accessory protein UreE [Gordonia westfalica]